MNRRRRTEILIKGNKEVLETIVKEIKDLYEIKKVQEGENGLAMIKVREQAKGELFYLGEVLITESKVYVGNSLGLGIVVGEDDNLATALAIVDGAYKNNPMEITRWDKLILKEEENINKEELKIARRIGRTKVDFSTMNV